MTHKERINARLTAHNQGVLAFLHGTRKRPPPKGSPGSVKGSYRAGWMSAQKAMEDERG